MYKMSYEVDPQNVPHTNAIIAIEGVVSVRFTARHLTQPIYLGTDGDAIRWKAERMKRVFIDVDYDGLDPNKTLKELVNLFEAVNEPA